MQKKSDKTIINEFWISYKKDIFLAAAIMVAAVILALVYQGRNAENRGKGIGVLEITVDGEVYGTYPLDQKQEISVVSPYGRNTVVIEQNMAYVTQADCPDKVCEGMQKISHEGEIICCLPHRLFLTVREAEKARYDAVAY